MEQGEETHLPVYDARALGPKSKPVLDLVDAHADDITQARYPRFQRKNHEYRWCFTRRGLACC